MAQRSRRISPADPHERNPGRRGEAPVRRRGFAAAGLDGAAAASIAVIHEPVQAVWMTRTIGAAIGVLLGPSTLLYMLAQLGLFSTCSSEPVLYGVMAAAWAIGLTALYISKLSNRARVILALIYTLAAIPLLPLFVLSASCSTGGCCL